MKKLSLLACILTLTPVFGQVAEGTLSNKTSQVTFQFRAGAGVTSYEENVAIEPVDSEWSAGTLEFEGRADIDVGGWLLSLSASQWATTEDEEKWTGQGQLIQTNELSARGGEFKAGAGPRLRMPAGTTVQPLLVAGGRDVSFERSNFVVEGKPSTLGTVQEDYAIGFAGLCLDLSHAVGNNLRLGTRFEADYVFFNEAENSLFSETLEGDGGTIFRADADISFRMGVNTWLVLGIAVDVQELSGTSLGSTEFVDDRPSFNFVEWPDNSLSRISGTAAFRIAL